MTDVSPKPYTPLELAAADRAAIRHRRTGKPNPPDPVDHFAPRTDPTTGAVIPGDALPVSTVAPDRVVEQLGLPHHPEPPVIATALRDLAKLVETGAPKAIRYAALYAARGWPGQTMGDGTGSSSRSELTSTESAVIGRVNEKDAIGLAIASGHFDGVDRRLAAALRMQDLVARQITTIVTDLLAHAQDLDRIPAGRGECTCCGKFCKGGEGNDRLRGAYCDACRKAWERAQAAAGEGGIDRSTFVHQRRHQIREGQDGVCELCDRPWTPAAEGAA